MTTLDHVTRRWVWLVSMQGWRHQHYQTPQHHTDTHTDTHTDIHTHTYTINVYRIEFSHVCELNRKILSVVEKLRMFVL